MPGEGGGSPIPGGMPWGGPAKPGFMPIIYGGPPIDGLIPIGGPILGSILIGEGPLIPPGDIPIGGCPIPIGGGPPCEDGGLVYII